MGILVRVSETHIEHLRMGLAKRFQGKGGRSVVGPFPATETGQDFVDFLNHAGHRRVQVQRFVGGTAGEAAPVIVDGETDALPGGKHHDAALVTGIPVGRLQHAGVGVGSGVVAVDALVVGPAAEHFAVAGVGEVMGVGHRHQALLAAVAQEVSVLRGIAPDKGHQGLAARFGGLPPIGGFERLGIFHEAGVRHQGRIGPGEKFLPAQAVERNDDKTGIVVPPGAGNQHQKCCGESSHKLFHISGNLIVFWHIRPASCR